MTTSEPTTVTEPGAVQKMTLPTLTAMVIGSMVGAGVFSLPARFGVATGILGSLIAWAIAGAGMLMLAFVFQNLALRKPDLDSGVFIYAKAGFGDRLDHRRGGDRVDHSQLAGQKSTGSRMIGQVMQCPPPRPRPSSAPTMGITSAPAPRSTSLVWVLRS